MRLQRLYTVLQKLIHKKKSVKDVMNVQNTLFLIICRQSSSLCSADLFLSSDVDLWFDQNDTIKTIDTQSGSSCRCNPLFCA